jgi:hypothetical protein
MLNKLSIGKIRKDTINLLIVIKGISLARSNGINRADNDVLFN